MKLFQSVCLRVLVILLSTAAAAVGADEPPATIRLRPSVQVDLTADTWIATIVIANLGTADAHRLNLSVEFDGQTQPWTETNWLLAAGTTLTHAHRFADVAAFTPGEYPLIVRITYRDDSGYPFSANLVTTVTHDPQETLPAAGLTLRLYPPTTLGKTGVLRLVSVSGLSVPVRARARLILPDGIETDEPEMELEIPPKAARGVSFPLHNRGGRAGSRLAVSAIVTYATAGIPRCITRSVAIAIPPHRGWLARHQLLGITLAVAGLALFALLQWPAFARRMPRLPAVPGLGWILWALILLLLTAHIPPGLLMRDTLTVGGDTPAHNYLASHLRTLWMAEGRLLTWSHAWWSGFPAFQFYFPLPYVLIAALSFLIPFNIAFKLVHVLGILLLPGSVYLAGRTLRFSKTVAALMTVTVLPFLFTSAHVMWGVNIYSTLAGMIANSLSFAIFPLVLACAWRDADDGRSRGHTTLLMAALILSHFFTSIVAALTIAGMPWLRPRAGARRALATLLRAGIPAVLITGWWLIPLIAKREYGVDFGGNWEVGLLASLPGAAALAVLPAAAAIVIALRRRGNRGDATWLWIWTTALATLLFFSGHALSPVFVNIRLWPFIYFGLLTLAAIGGGRILDRCRYTQLAVMAFALLVAIRIDTQPSRVRAWAEWNLEGLEAKPLAAEFRRLIEPLDGTPGRLAYDLNEISKAFGSSRIFEVVPHLIDKPIIEGGLVNSALGSLFAYTIQGEISAQGAGYPAIVPPSDFNPDLAQAHLELFNVRHIITAWPELQAALNHSTAWRVGYRVDDWNVFEAVGGDPGMIGVLEAPPTAVHVSDRQRAAVAWMQHPALLDRPFVWLKPQEPPPSWATVITETDYRSLLEKLAAVEPAIPEGFRFDSGPVTVTEWAAHRIRFRTTAVGRPHLIKVSFFPNWQVRGAPEIRMVSPAFMLLVPDQPELELIYGYTLADRIGQIVTIIGIAWLVIALGRAAVKRLRKLSSPLRLRVGD